MSQNLVNLLESLRGRDMAKMTESETDAFKSSVTERFRAASADVTSGLIGLEHAGYLWNVETLEFDGIARYSLRPSDLIEANLDSDGAHVRMAAALFPEVQIRVDILGEYHNPGGLSTEPKLSFALRVDDEACLDALQRAEQAVYEHLVNLCRANKFELSVESVGSGVGESANPEDLRLAIRLAASAMEEDAIRQAGEWSAQLQTQQEPMLEALEVRVEISTKSTLSPPTIDALIKLFGALLRSCVTGT